ncbi:MAG TPA: DUF4199 domain-containing protein [Pyrinomonadaceae bacterium]|nr:DUF4199 domain-containing protein [Pyrinomonadaceae bacterium]
MNRKALIGVGVLAGLAQVVAGVAMYLAGVYFAPWSMFVNLFLLLLCIVVGTKWYAARYLNGKITYRQALGVGVVISISTGLIYALYNLISISWFYPNFLDELVRARMAQPTIAGTPSFAAMRAEVSALGIAVPNLIRLSIFGSILSLLTSLFLKRK